MAIFLSYLFYFIASSASPLQRRWLFRNREYTTKEQIHLASQCIFILFIGSLFFPFFSKFYIAPAHGKILFLALTCGLVGTICNSLNYLTFKHLEAGTGAVVGNVYTPVTIFLSSVFLKEGLTSLQIIGTALLFISIFIISKKHRTGRFTFDKYFVLAFLSSVIISVLLVAERELQRTTGFSAGVMFSWGAQALCLFLFSSYLGHKHTYTKKEVFVTGGLQFFQALSYVILVWIVANLSLVSSITTFKVVIMFIAGAIFLHEREDMPRKILGSLIAVAGLLLMK